MDLDALKRLEEAASPAPWEAFCADDGYDPDFDLDEQGAGWDLRCPSGSVFTVDTGDFQALGEADAKFIVALRNALPSLLEAAGERDELERYKAVARYADNLEAYAEFHEKHPEANSIELWGAAMGRASQAIEERDKARALMREKVDALAQVVDERDEARGEIEAQKARGDSLAENVAAFREDAEALQAKVARLDALLGEALGHLRALNHERKRADCSCGNPGHRDHAPNCEMVAVVTRIAAALEGKA